MPKTKFESRASDFELRPATLDDATIVADLESLRDPEEPRDPVLLRHWWRMGEELHTTMHRVAVRDGAAIAYIAASHERWDSERRRFGDVRPVLRGDVWSTDRFESLVEIGEDWLRAEGAATSVVRVREDIKQDLGALERLGYREDRRMRLSELDLGANRDQILSAREESRRRMHEQGIEMLPLSKVADADRYRKLYAMWIESEQDIPTTVPSRDLTLEEWKRFWFTNPAIGEDRMWVAIQDGHVAGISLLDTPVVRGVPWTAYTGTARAFRGRGIARALKYESIGQAVESGFTRVRTNNDADNPAILSINQEMGYRLVAPLIELHRKLDS